MIHSIYYSGILCNTQYEKIQYELAIFVGVVIFLWRYVCENSMYERRSGGGQRRYELNFREDDADTQNNTDVQKAMDSLDHDLLTGETLDVGDKVTRRLSQEQATLPHPAAKSSGPIQSKQEIAAEAVKKMNCVPKLGRI